MQLLLPKGRYPAMKRHCVVRTVGGRKGEFPGMLKDRTLNIMLVKDQHGNGVATTENPDQVVKYGGAEIKVKVGG